MKVLLLDAPYDRLQGVKVTFNYPLGLAYLASYLRRAGHKTLYLNLDWDPALPSFNPFSTEAVNSRYHNYLRESSDNSDHSVWSEVVDILEDFQPDLVGISASTIKIKSVFKLIKIIKDFSPLIRVVLGGHHTQVYTNEIMERNGNVDFVIRGEAEETLLALAEELSQASGRQFDRIPGLVYRDDDHNINFNPERGFIEDLDALPLPSACHYYARGRYVQLPRNAVMASRGCPYSCKYCATNNMWKRKVRTRSVGDVIREIKDILAHRRERFLTFYDDCFTLDKRWLHDFCSTVIRERIKFNWQCITGVNLLDADIIKEIVRAGCVKINVGIESGSDRVLDRIGKNINLDKVRLLFRESKQYRLSTTAYIMIGFPGETGNDIRLTQSLIREIKPNWVYCNALIPLPGTAIYDSCVESGLIDAVSSWNGDYIKCPVMNYTNTMPDGAFFKLADETFDICYKVNTKISNLMKRAPLGSYLNDPLSLFRDARRFIKFIRK